MKTAKLYFAVSLFLIMIVFTGCVSDERKEETAGQRDDEELRIGFSFDTFVLERWIRDRDVFVSTAQKLGAVVDVQNANGDVAKQREQIRRFIEGDVDVIVVVAVDCFAVDDLVEQARNKGIDVISYDRMIQGTVTDLYITVDSGRVGEEMARMIMEYLPEGGNVVIIGGPEMDTNSMEVIEGFERKIEGSNLVVVSKTHVESWTPEHGFKAAAEAVNNVEQIDAIMCGNDGLAGYAVRALSEKKLAGKVLVTGQDADVEACQRIVEGTQLMTVYKPIEQLAKTAAECAVKFAKGDNVVGKDIGRSDIKKTIDGREVPYLGLEPISVTKKNMNEIIVDPGFHLGEEVYINVDK